MLMRSRFLGVAVAVTLVSAPAGAPPVGAPDRFPFAVFRHFARPASFGVERTLVTDDKVWTLGARLFFEKRLSASSTSSCASCHLPDQSWSDHLPRAIGDAHKPLAFRAPTLLNAGETTRFGWTGRFPDIEAVAFFAMTAPLNMNLSIPELCSRLGADPTYVAAFKAAFPDGSISKHNIGLALTRYVRSITSDTAPFDRWIAGHSHAISPSAARGFAVFNGKGRCAECHSGWAFTDGSFHDIGIGRGEEIGRGTLFKTSVKLQYAFKTPTLRNVASRAPYMHDGSLATLDAVVDHYDKGGIDRPSRAEAVRPLRLTPGEKQDLIAFLTTLSSGTTFVLPAED
jgi:cytochrome c peroxidase